MDQEQLQRMYTDQGIQISLGAVPDSAQPLFYTQVPGGDAAYAIWQQLRALTEQTGYWPLLMGADGLWFASALAELDTQHWLAQAKERKGEQYFAERVEMLPDPDDEVDEWEEYAEELGLESPEFNPPSGLLSTRDVLSREPLVQVTVVLLPTRQGFEAAAWLGFGGWNECPDPVWQVAIQQDWCQRYGAEPVVMGHDVLEMRLSRPPLDEAAALALAREQYLFCCDIVDQGVMTIANLQQSLLGSELWYFWWD